MSTLYRLKRTGKHLITDAFVRDEQAQIHEDEYDPYVEPVDDPTASDTASEVDLSALHDALGQVADEYDEFDSAIDAAVAPAVHQYLPLSRRVASDPGVWHYLASIEFPYFVRHRWRFTTETAMREKFLGAGTDIYSNALHRLWWIAELTVDPAAADPYRLTRAVLQNQTLANKIFDRWFARYQPAARLTAAVLLDRLTALPDDISETEYVEEATLWFRQSLSKSRLEGMSEEEIETEISRICDDVERELAATAT